MKAIKFLSVALLLGNAALAQTEEVRPVDPFTGIELSGAVDVTLKSGPTQEVKISSKDGNTKTINTSIKNNHLVISGGGSADVEVTMPTIDFLKVSGAGDLKTSGVIKAESITINLSGAGDVEMELEVNNLTSNVSGAGDAEYRGKATNHTLNVSGAGDVVATNLVTQNTTATISGTGDAKVYAVENLNAKISGMGGIFYKNEPKIKSIDVTAAGSSTQIENDKSDTTRLKLGDNQIIIVPGEENDNKNDSTHKSKSYKSSGYHHWAGFDLGVNGITNYYGELKHPANYDFLELNYGKSFNFRLNFIEKDLNIYQEKINLVTGLGFEWANYGLLNKYTLIPNADTISASFTPVKFKKNRLQGIWVNVPLLLEFNTSNKAKKSAHLALGVVGGYRIGGNMKQIYYVNDKKYKNKVRDDFNMNDYKVALTARVGYKWINLWGEYNLTPMLKNNQGPKIYPVTVGVTLIPFND